MQAVLVMFRPDGERRSFSLVRDITVVGRREDCDLRIPLSDVSRKHCRIVRDGDALRLEDLGSSNGTYLNGQRIQEALLQPGDTLQVGPVAFVLQVDGVPADDELSPVIAGAAAGAGAAAVADAGELEAGDLEELSDNDQLPTAGAEAADDGQAADLEPIAADADELEPLPADGPLGEDAGFDILAADEDQAAPIDIDAEEQENRR